MLTGRKVGILDEGCLKSMNELEWRRKIGDCLVSFGDCRLSTPFCISEVASVGYFRARGRCFTIRQLQRIKYLTERYFDEGRTAISERVCSFLRWKQANGRLKDVACREVLRKLEEEGVINLPSPKRRGRVSH